jgi:hypothetical protein
MHGRCEAPLDLTGVPLDARWRSARFSKARSHRHLSVLRTVMSSNVAHAYYSPPSLDDNTFPNQQFRPDLVSAAAVAANPFTVAPPDVLLHLYQTEPGDPVVSGYNTIAADTSAFVQKDVCLRFAMVDNIFYVHAGVDSVSISLR